MARQCYLTGKTAGVGNKRSHALNASRRRWNVNLQKVKIVENGEVKTVLLSAKAIKTLNNKPNSKIKRV